MLGTLARLFQQVARNAPFYLVVDIGSSTAIRSLVVTEDRSGNLTIVKKRAYELPRRDRKTELLPAIEEYLRRLIFDVIRETERLPRKILIGLGSQFTFNQMATAHRTRANPKLVIRPEEFEKLAKDFADTNRELTVRGESYTLAHLMPFKVTVDGYAIREPNEHTRGAVIEIVFFATYAATDYWQTLNHVRERWGGLTLEFRSNQAAIAAAIVELLGVTDALILKLAGKVTEISLLSQGVIVATGQIAVGADSFTDAIARALGMSVREAETLKRQWDTVELSRDRRLRAEQALFRAIEAWLDQLIRFLKDEEHFILPERVYVLGGGVRLPLVMNILETRHWYGELTFLEKIDMEILMGKELAKKIFTNTQLTFDGPEDVALAALAHQLKRISH